MYDMLAKPAAIATCGLFNMKRRAKEALSGQGSIEWIIIVVIIAVALIAGLSLLANQMNNKLNLVTDTLKGTTTSGNTPH
jgi:Flp pilus assembly pilin Flp